VVELQVSAATERAVPVLLIEDDPGDALLVQEYLAEAGPAIELTWVQTIAEAKPHLSADTRCVLLDLQLPDAKEFSGLDAVLDAAPRAAVIVLTGFTDQARGVDAVAHGAQDYLTKAQLEPDLLARTIRYALQRRTAEDTARELADSRARAAENARLERGLLPVAITHDDSVRVVARYRPGRDRALLGGDFYDVVQCPDGTVYAMIGDVSGHGPDEAALGVCLRVAWRTLVLAGLEEETILPLLAQVLDHERAEDHIFASVCMVRVAGDHRSARVYLAGHPPPLVLDGQASRQRAGVPLGVLDDYVWAAEEIALTLGWELVLMTDGIFEGTAAPDTRERLGMDGLVELLQGQRAATPDPRDWTDALIGLVIELNGGPLTDDLALLVLSGGKPERRG
jgi:serine phosphatase RsbU (regulator of sigma subunit)